MRNQFLFTAPTFTARDVAKVMGQKLGRELAYQEATDDADVDGNVDVTSRIHVQVGADYVIVGAWSDEFSLRSWPARRSIHVAANDLLEALHDFPEEPHES